MAGYRPGLLNRFMTALPPQFSNELPAHCMEHCEGSSSVVLDPPLRKAVSHRHSRPYWTPASG